MPELKNVTVAGKVFKMPVIFNPGDEITLTEGQASQFNQVFHENIRNNFAKKIKDAQDKNDFDQDAFQAQIDKYADEYEFGTRKSGGPRVPSDPVAKEALRIAIDAISNSLRAQGKKPSDFKNLKEVAAQLVERKPEITEKARQIVAERQTVAESSLGDVMSGLEEKPAESAQAAE